MGCMHVRHERSEFQNLSCRIFWQLACLCQNFFCPVTKYSIFYKDHKDYRKDHLNIGELHRVTRLILLTNCTFPSSFITQHSRLNTIFFYFILNTIFFYFIFLYFLLSSWVQSSCCPIWKMPICCESLSYFFLSLSRFHGSNFLKLCHSLPFHFLYVTVSLLCWCFGIYPNRASVRGLFSGWM